MKNQLQFLRTRLKRPHILIFITGEISIQFCQGNVLPLLQGSFSEHVCNTRSVSLSPQPVGLDTQQITLSAGSGAEGKPCSNCRFDPTASQSTVQCINHLLESTAGTKLLSWKKRIDCIGRSDVTMFDYAKHNHAEETLTALSLIPLQNNNNQLSNVHNYPAQCTNYQSERQYLLIIKCWVVVILVSNTIQTQDSCMVLQWNCATVTQQWVYQLHCVSLSQEWLASYQFDPCELYFTTQSMQVSIMWKSTWILSANTVTKRKFEHHHS